jgi:23S rRNA pseudouridine2605 synthase
MDEENHTEGGIVKERIAKRIARAGVCSRRDAERLIAEGHVKVNGVKLDSPAFTVSADDEIKVNGKILPSISATRLFLYHKPAGLVTTHRDEKGRPTVFERLPKGLPRVVSVGRLDLNSEGLLLLTNDGSLARYLELPATGWTRKYRVRVLGAVDQSNLDQLKQGITIDGVHYKSIQAVAEKSKDKANTWLSVALREGKNREIRRVMEALGLQVNRLIRVAYGPFNLDELPRGGVQEIKPKVLHDQIAG